jgi:hypothetical protein
LFDCETRIDESQRLTFGVYRVFDRLRLIEEGIFHGDDLPAADLAVLTDYVATRVSDASERGKRARPLPLLSRREFVREVFLPLAYKSKALVVGFNLPFDLSRIAIAAAPGRGYSAGGFSLTLDNYETADGTRAENPFRPRIAYAPIDSKRARIHFTAVKVDATKRYSAAFRGHFLDLKTLAFCLTDRGHSLASACAAFGVTDGKQRVEEHGLVTEDYVDYCRQDVRASWQLYLALRAEYERHAIPLQATRAYSPASMGKAYLQAMNVHLPALVPDASAGMCADAVFGACMAAYFGGRAECRIRKHPVPIVALDFRSMYPTVNALVNLWPMLTAESVSVVDATADVETFLASITADDLFERQTWQQLTAIVEVQPDADILPVRTDYGLGEGYQIGVNRFTSEEPAWYTLADCVAAKLLTGRAPRVLRALRFVPHGRQPDMRPVSIRGAVHVDPYQADFFCNLIEIRNSLPTDSGDAENDRLRDVLKVLANATTYGIFVELNRHVDEESECEVWTGSNTPFRATVKGPEHRGPFTFPPLATLITGAARLMLALLEARVAERGGTYAFCDTDSMAVVATPDGGPVPCPDGPLRSIPGEAVRALSYGEVEAIRTQFDRLNPYTATSLTSDRMLKWETKRMEAGDRARQLWCVAISAKRYATFSYDELGNPVVHEAKEHGLGHLLSPDDPPPFDEPDPRWGKEWIRREWETIIRERLGLPIELSPALDAVAVGRLSVSKASVLHAFRYFNEGKDYSDQIKPANFLITTHVAPFGHPAGTDPSRFRLVRPFELSPRKRTERWTNIYDGNRYMAAAGMVEPSAGIAVLSTYRDVVSQYRRHPESKSGDTDGNPSNEETIGLLTRLHVVALGSPRYIGKESNELEDVEAGIVGDADSVYVTYTDRERELALLRTVLSTLPRRPLAGAAGIDERSLRRIISGQSTPTAKHRNRLLTAVTLELARRLAPAGIATGERLPFEVLAAMWLQPDADSARVSASRIISDASLPKAPEIATMAESEGELTPRSTMPT